MSATLIKQYCIRAIPIGTYVGMLTIDGKPFTILTDLTHEILPFISEDNAEGKIREIVDRNLFGENKRVLAYEILSIYLQPK